MHSDGGDAREFDSNTSDANTLEQRYWDLAKNVVSQTGYLLYDVEYSQRNKTLQVFIMDKSTKSAVIEDCAAVDRAFTPFVEEADWIPDDFVLEVSSPGVYRKLKTWEHFQSALGERIKLELRSDELAKQLKIKKRFNAFLENVDEQNELLILDKDEVEVKLRISDVKSAHLDPAL